MTRKSINDIRIPTFDDIFLSEEQRQDARAEKVVKINLDDISDFENHPFCIIKKKKKDDEYDMDMAKLISSIEKNGLLVPIMVRKKKDGAGYEMISGHRRKYALKKLGVKEVDAIVRDLNDYQATILMVDSNLSREEILPCEKGKAYAMRLDAMKHQGKPLDDDTCGQLDHKLTYRKKSIDKLSDFVGESRKQVQRYIRLSYLNEDLQRLVNGLDETKKIAFLPAVELSYLSQKEQEILMDVINRTQSTPSLAQAKEFKQRSQKGILDEFFIFQLLNDDKPNQKEKLSINNEEIDRYFPKGYTEQQKREQILKLLKNWHKNRERNQR